MMTKRPLIAILAAASLVGVPAIAAETDPLKATLEESRTSGKGLTFYVNGQAIPGVVLSVDERHLVARSTASGTVVIRLDRLDGIAGHVPPPAPQK